MCLRVRLKYLILFARRCEIFAFMWNGKRCYCLFRRDKATGTICKRNKKCIQFV